MKVYILAYGSGSWQNGQLIYREALRQKKEVRLGFIEWPFSHVLRDIQRDKPDYIFLTGSRAFPAENLFKLAKIAKLLIWDADGLIDVSREQTWKDLKGIPHIIVLSVLGLVQKYSDYAQIKTCWIPQYYDSEYFKVPVDGYYVPKYKQESYDSDYDFDVCFIGGCDDGRFEWLKRVSKDYKVIMTGYRGNIQGGEMAWIYSRSKIAVGLLRQSSQAVTTAFSTSDRLFKSMGCGAFYLTYPIEKVDLLFTPDMHLGIYEDNYKDFENKVEYWLSHDALREVAARAGQRLVLEKHTLKVRIPQYWKVMEDDEYLGFRTPY